MKVNMYNTAIILIICSILLGERVLSFPLKGDTNESQPNQIVVAKVADRLITLNDFIERSEYTLRPAYCKGNSSVEKNIILNTLIAEKLLSLEAGQDNELLKNERFISFIAGRREQKMRSLLNFYEGTDKVKLDSAEILRIFSIAGRTYSIQYINIPEKNIAGLFTDKLNTSLNKSEAFISGIKEFTSLDSIPEREVSWNSPENEIIHKALFSDKLVKGQILGPLNISDSVHLFIKIKSWSDRVAVNERDVKERWVSVIEKLTTEKADSIYEKFILGIMGNKTLDFNADILNKLIKLYAPYYTKQNKEIEDEFLRLAYDNNSDLPDFKALDGFDEIKEQAVMKIDGNIWTVSDLQKQIDRHPLVFRKDNVKDKFAIQLRLALVDLIRDKYLTDETYKRGYDKTELVTHYEQQWLDASTALYERDKYLIKAGQEEINISFIEQHLNDHIRSLLKKYSKHIEINVVEYDKIKLTRTDMFTTQSGVPYKIYVPAFPQLTNHNRLDYGRKMD